MTYSNRKQIFHHNQTLTVSITEQRGRNKTFSGHRESREMEPKTADQKKLKLKKSSKIKINGIKKDQDIMNMALKPSSAFLKIHFLCCLFKRPIFACYVQSYSQYVLSLALKLKAADQGLKKHANPQH